jgi:hypothetical protein
MAEEDDAARAVITAIARGLAARLNAPGVNEVLARLEAQDLGPAAFTSPEARRLPACRHLPQAVGAALELDSNLAAHLAEVEDRLHWKQNPNYSDARMGQPGYMANYAYAELIGPSGFFAGEDFLLGLMVLGPHLHYLDHRHAAPELYWLLTGPSLWRRGSGDFVQHPAGETTWHDPFVVHATRTGDEPLLAVWAWTRDVSQPAELV